MIGPVFVREVVTIPRRARLFVGRTVYVSALLILMCTAWLIVTGTQNVRNLGDAARFGAALFELLAPLQLALALIFAAIVAASAVAQEKDRQTLILLLLTNLSNAELVLGKLLASLLFVLVILAAAVPVFLIATLLGGVSFGQVGRAFAVTLATVIVAGSFGSTMALWREKTFQTLALTTLSIVGWISFWEVVAAGAFGAAWQGVAATTWAACCSPWRAVLIATEPGFSDAARGLGTLSPFLLFILAAAAGTILLNAIAIARVRVWNPTREVLRGKTTDDRADTIWSVEVERQFAADQTTGETTAASPAETSPRDVANAAPVRIRSVWTNPVLWREMRTWAYGRKILIVRIGYLLLFAAAAWTASSISSAGHAADVGRAMIPAVAAPLVPLLLISLILQNALALTSITNERDGKSLDLLLVTDLSAKEILFGKLGGVFYNTKEMVLLPMLLCVYLAWRGEITSENLAYLLGGLLVMYSFAMVLGLHVGMTYSNSRSATGASLGTLVFLFVGIATCLRMMVAFAGSFQTQLQPFLAFMVGGGLGLFATLGLRNPSRAIFLASMFLPLATFLAITNFLLDSPLTVFLLISLAYGFTTAAMLVPALHEFDIATGRSSGEND